MFGLSESRAWVAGEFRIDFSRACWWHLVIFSQGWVLVCSDDQFDVVVKWLEESLGHVDNCTGNDLFLFLFEHFLLFMGSDLQLLQGWLTCPLLED